MHVARSPGRGWPRGAKGRVRLDDPKRLFCIRATWRASTPSSRGAYMSSESHAWRQLVAVALDLSKIVCVLVDHEEYRVGFGT
jgi:hypothetical protein